MWAGPPVSEVPDPFRRDARVKAMVDRLADPATTIEQGEAAIEKFSRTLAADKNEILTAVFAELLRHSNVERSKVLAGIKRFAKQQNELAEKISLISEEMRQTRSEDDAETKQRLEELEEKRTWALRVFDERQKMITYLCEKPVEIEQRLGALARALMYGLD